jgi:hypothetical protein
MIVASDKNSRRRGWQAAAVMVVVVVAVAVVVNLGLMGESGVGLEVGVIRVGDAIVWLQRERNGGRERVYVFGQGGELGFCHVGLSPYLSFGFYG